MWIMRDTLRMLVTCFDFEDKQPYGLRKYGDHAASREILQTAHITVDVFVSEGLRSTKSLYTRRNRDIPLLERRRQRDQTSDPMRFLCKAVTLGHVFGHHMHALIVPSSHRELSPIISPSANANMRKTNNVYGVVTGRSVCGLPQYPSHLLPSVCCLQ